MRRELRTVEDWAIKVIVVLFTFAFFFGSCFDRDVGVATWFK